MAVPLGDVNTTKHYRPKAAYFDTTPVAKPTRNEGLRSLPGGPGGKKQACDQPL